VAHAEGSEIAIRYMVKHPDRVEHVVFYSPTSMWNDQNFFNLNSRTAVEIISVDPLVGVRQTVALALGLYNPRAAEAYVSQEEMTIWADLFTDEGLMVCAGDRELAPNPESPGFNPYVGLIGDVTDDARPDPRVRLREVFVPTILLRGECDYVDWGVVQQYWQAVPNIHVYYVEGAGSMLHLSQPDLVKQLILAFLNDERMPLAPLSERAIRKALPLTDGVR
jgi:pimeloyl-ACP methyl ester carboxylesterase